MSKKKKEDIRNKKCISMHYGLNTMMFIMKMSPQTAQDNDNLVHLDVRFGNSKLNQIFIHFNKL